MIEVFDPLPLMHQADEAVAQNKGRYTPPPLIPAKLARARAKVLPPRPRIERLIIPKAPERPTFIFRMAAE